MPHESFRGLQSVHGDFWSALVDAAVNYSLTQHRVVFPTLTPPHTLPSEMCLRIVSPTLEVAIMDTMLGLGSPSAKQQPQL